MLPCIRSCFLKESKDFSLPKKKRKKEKENVDAADGDKNLKTRE